MGLLLNAVLLGLIAFGVYKFDEFRNREEAGEFLVENVNKSYDYIIVGCGAAGSVLAKRLSEDAGVTVLALEAGVDDRGEIILKTPGFTALAQHGKFDWEYYTEPQKHTLEDFKGRRSFWPRGKVLGGSSNLNYMMYFRGRKHDFDMWVESGAKGWSYTEVWPYFLKSEDMTDDSLKSSKYHNTGGELKISMPETMPLTSMIIKAGQELGFPLRDPNDEGGEGIYKVQSTSYRGVRSSASRAFLHPVMSRENLHVQINSHVTKVIFEGTRAVGVEMIHGGKKKSVRANREVILASGSIGSPQILMLSGVGPKDHLETLGIPVVANLPVGSNLQDHLFFDFSVAINDTLGATDELKNSLWTHLQQRVFGAGVLSGCFGEANLFGYTNDKSRTLEWPDLQIIFHETPWTSDFLRGFGYTEEALKEVASRRKHKDMFACLPTLLQPKSRGTLKLKSKDPFDHPTIDPNYLEKEEDLNVLVAGIQLCQKLLETPTMKKLGAAPADGPNRHCKSHSFGSAPYWKCILRRRVITVNHPVGTCKMGPKADPTAVVDLELRVHGTSGLRVVDASIMPTITAAPTYATAIMIGEKAADMIRSSRKS